MSDDPVLRELHDLRAIRGYVLAVLNRAAEGLSAEEARALAEEIAQMPPPVHFEIVTPADARTDWCCR